MKQRKSWPQWSLDIWSQLPLNFVLIFLCFLCSFSFDWENIPVSRTQECVCPYFKILYLQHSVLKIWPNTVFHVWYIILHTNCLYKCPTEIIMYLLLSTSLEELWFVDPFLFPWSLFLYSKSVSKYININTNGVYFIAIATLHQFQKDDLKNYNIYITLLARIVWQFLSNLSVPRKWQSHIKWAAIHEEPGR